jgi:hypothetical protein
MMMMMRSVPSPMYIPTLLAVVGVSELREMDCPGSLMSNS